MRKASQRQCCYVWSPIKLTSENWHAPRYGAFVLETASLLFCFLHNNHKPQFLWLCLTRERVKPLKISGLAASVSFCVKSFSVGRYEVNRLFQWNREAIIAVEQTNEAVCAIWLFYQFFSDPLFLFEWTQLSDFSCFSVAALHCKANTGRKAEELT